MKLIKITLIKAATDHGIIISRVLSYPRATWKAFVDLILLRIDQSSLELIRLNCIERVFCKY